MKAVFSYWSAPSRSGWGSDELLLSSFSMAVMEASKHYTPILYADEEFLEFIEPLDFSWGEVNVVDFSQNNVSDVLWSYPNLYAVLKEEPPFIHFDNDFFAHSPLPSFENMLFERNFDITQDKRCKKAIEKIKQLPNAPRSWNPKTDHILTCGVIGCKSNQWKREWVYPAIDWMKNTKNKIQDRSLPYATVFEEHFAASVGEKIGNFDVLSQVSRQPRENNEYTHLSGSLKKLPRTKNRLRTLIKRKYPAIYEKINEITKT